MTPRVRVRLLLASLLALLAWFAWAERRQALDERAAVRQARDRSAEKGVASARERERRALLGRVVERLARRAPPPASAAAVRAVLLREAEAQGAELSSARLQPLVRPPAGTAGTEARVTLLGEPVALSAFLAQLAGQRWPLRIDRATLAVRGGLGTLTATVLVFWPDRAASFTEADAARLAADDRVERLFHWLGPRADAPALVSARTAEPAPRPLTAPAPEPATQAPPDAPAAASPPPPEVPELHGFVEVGPEAPVRAALHYEGETILAAIGDRIGVYTVVAIEPAAAIVLSRPDGASLRLVLR